jgi:hypothetical protein
VRGSLRFDFYAAVKKGVHKAAVEITGAGTPALEHYWEDGPQYTGWGAVVGRCPDGTAAIVEGTSGKGWVLLVGAMRRWSSSSPSGLNPFERPYFPRPNPVSSRDAK